jgi:hypothetical protein
MISRKGAFVVGVIAALVIGSGSAYAATGGTFVLGHNNSATKVTTLTNSKGTALKLRSKAGTAPLAVSSGTRVANLNSDRIDGLDSTALALVAGTTAFVVANGAFVDLNSDGTADALFATATCPAGTKLTGGGVDNFTSFGFTPLFSPSGGNQWTGASLADPAVDLVTDLQAYAVCYNPRGAVPGGVPTWSQAAASAHTTLASEIPPAAKARLARLQSKQK